MAGIKSFKRQSSGNAPSREQENVKNVVNQVLSKEIIDGILIKGVCLHAGTSYEVDHGLGREPLGWVIVRKRADSRVWDLQDYNPNTVRTLVLVASHDITIDLWVF